MAGGAPLAGTLPPPRRARLRTSGPADAPAPRLYYGWIVVGVAFGASLAQTVFFNPILGVFVTPLGEEFGWSRVQISAAITIGGIGAGLAAPWIGALLDRRGARLIVPPVALLMAFCLVGLSRIDALWQLYVLYAIGRGLTIGVISAAVVVSLGNWFVRRRPLAISIAVSGQRVGLALLPALTAFVIAAADDWRAGWLALAAVLVLLGVAPFLLVPRRPEDRGLLPDGGMPADATAPVEARWTLREAMRTRAYWLIGFATTMAVMSGGAVNFHQIPHLEDRGLASTTAALVVTVWSLSAAAGGLAGGWLGTRWRPRWVFASALILQAGALLLLVAVQSVPLAMLYAVTYGVLFGAMFTMLESVHADYFGRASLGAIRGSIQPVVLTANALSPLLVGAWHDVAGSYDLAFVFLAASYVVGSIGLWFAPYPRHPSEAEANPVRVG